MKNTIVSSMTVFVLVFGMWAGVFAKGEKDSHTSSKFEGAKANTGFVVHSVENGKQVLTLSDDFTVPDTPDPHWQVVDKDGNVYLMHRLKIKDDKINKRITLPKYVKSVAKVQIWCAWAEALLGEASFSKPQTASIEFNTERIGG